MKEIRFTGQYKKDLKKYLNQPKKLERLRVVINMLREELPMPEVLRPHKLSGNYKGCMECHIEGDFLLIWIDENSGIITLFRIGSHSELFKN